MQILTVSNSMRLENKQDTTIVPWHKKRINVSMRSVYFGTPFRLKTMQTKIKNDANRIVFYFVVFSCYYASLIAPTGQPSSQAPQSMHCSGSTTYLLSPSAIAPTGQVSAQAPHWMHSSLITLGIVLSPYKIDSLSLAIILAHPTAFDKS